MKSNILKKILHLNDNKSLRRSEIEMFWLCMIVWCWLKKSNWNLEWNCQSLDLSKFWVFHWKKDWFQYNFLCLYKILQPKKKNIFNFQKIQIFFLQTFFVKMTDFASNSWNFDAPWKMRFLNITYSLSVTYVLQSANIKSLPSKFLSILF